MTGYGAPEHLVRSPRLEDLRARDARVVYAWDGLIHEWLENGSAGVEHGLGLLSPPDGAEDGWLHFHFDVHGGLFPTVNQDGRGATFRTAQGQAVLQYLGLVAFDADGRSLPARMSADGGLTLTLQVDTRGARYPVTIDPMAKQAYLKAAVPGKDSFGAGIAICGDTVVIGAPLEAGGSSGVNGDQTDDAPWEDSASGGVNGDPSDDSLNNAGAAYVFDDCQTLAVATAYGAGKPGTAGTPVLMTVGTPTLGTTPSLVLAPASGQNRRGGWTPGEPLCPHLGDDLGAVGSTGRATTIAV